MVSTSSTDVDGSTPPDGLDKLDRRGVVSTSSTDVGRLDPARWSRQARPTRDGSTDGAWSRPARPTWRGLDKLDRRGVVSTGLDRRGVVSTGSTDGRQARPTGGLTSVATA